MTCLVRKYGGTSVGSPERIRSVARQVADAYKINPELVVVVSAMGSMTDELIDLAHQVSRDPSRREMDMLLTTGERISMALLSMALRDLGVPALSLTGSQSGIITDGSHRRARIQRILGDRIRAALKDKKVAIVAGFQGVSEKREITTLGRGGSDTTAVALAATLGASTCEIYTDVDGVYAADPRMIADARFCSRIGYAAMIQMATLGAGVLHPRSVLLARKYGVAIKVANSLKPDGEGTLVTEKMEESRFTGVTCDEKRMLVRIELERPTVAGAVWNEASQKCLGVLLPTIEGTRMRFFIEGEARLEWKKLLEKRMTEGFVKSFEICDDLVPLSLVSEGFQDEGSIICKVYDVLGREHVPIESAIASAFAVTVATRRTHIKEGVQALYREFGGRMFL